MKYLKITLGIGLIPLGIFVGSFIPIGEGSGAIIGGILGAILCCMLFWSGPSWANTSDLDERHQVNCNMDQRIIDATIRSVERAKIENEISSARMHKHF